MAGSSIWDFFANLYVEYLLYIHKVTFSGLAWYHTTPVPPENLKAKFKDPYLKVGVHQRKIPDLPRVKPRLGKESFDPYIYDTLPSSRHIRLLILDAGSDGDPISFRLALHNLNNSTSYKALSYTWGDHRNTILAKCHDKHVKLRRNLYSALWHLRDKQNQRIIRVDSVCINQDDLAERSSQVLLMRDIYRGATATVVWLGNEAKESAKGFEVIMKLSELALSPRHPSTGHLPVTAQELDSVGLPAANSKEWRAIDAIFWRAWYFRVWIIQEISVSRSVIVHCGTHSIQWRDLAQAAYYIQARYFESVTGVQAGSATTLDQFARAYSTNVQRSLHQLLVESRYSLATDPRDHVYALLGLVSDHISNAIIPNYSKDFADLYTSVTAQIIQEEKNLDVLTNVVDSRILLGKRGNLPSWVPNWAVSPRTTPLLQLRYSSYSATGNSEAQMRFVSSKLLARGYSIDRIKHVGNTFMVDRYRTSFLRLYERIPVPDLPETNFGRGIADSVLATCILLGEKFASKLSAYPTGESITEALSSVLIASHTISGENMPPLFEAYSSFRHYLVDPFLKLKFSQISVLHDRGHDREAALAYRQAHELAADWRRLAISEKGYLGLFPLSCRKGDNVILLSGGKTPYLVRKNRNSTWTFLGDCYIHGYMNGETWNQDAILKEFEFG